MGSSIKYPFVTVPRGELTPSHPAGGWVESLRQDIEVIRWFIVQRMDRPLKASPLEELLGMYDAVLKSVPEPEDDQVRVTTIEEMVPDHARHRLHEAAMFSRLAWAIRVLCGRNAIEEIDGSFITSELLGADNLAANRRLPGGIGTLVTAARLVQAGDGGRVRVYGHGSKGLDVRWTGTDRRCVLVERKDRSYEAGLNDSIETRARKVAGEVKTACIPQEAGALRVLIVGFQYLVTRPQRKPLDRAYGAVLADLVSREAYQLPNLPNFVIAEHLGLEPKTGGKKSNFLSPHWLNRRRHTEHRYRSILLGLLGNAGV